MVHELLLFWRSWYRIVECARGYVGSLKQFMNNGSTDSMQQESTEDELQSRYSSYTHHSHTYSLSLSLSPSLSLSLSLSLHLSISLSVSLSLSISLSLSPSLSLSLSLSVSLFPGRSWPLYNAILTTASRVWSIVIESKRPARRMTNS